MKHTAILRPTALERRSQAFALAGLLILLFVALVFIAILAKGHPGGIIGGIIGAVLVGDAGGVDGPSVYENEQRSVGIGIHLTDEEPLYVTKTTRLRQIELADLASRKLCRKLLKDPAKLEYKWWHRCLTFD